MSWRLLLLCVVLLSPSLAGPAQAQSSPEVSLLPDRRAVDGTLIEFTGPKVKGFRLTGIIRRNGDVRELRYSLTRGTERHDHLLDPSGSIKVDDRLSSGRATFALKRFGKGDLDFESTGPVRSAPAPAGCSGKRGRSRRGVLTGKLRLVVDRSYFKTVVLRRMKARVVQRPSVSCPVAPDGNPVPSIGDLPVGTNPANLLVQAPGGRVTLQVVKVDRERSGGVERLVTHSITEQDLPASAFSIAADKTATVTGAGRISGVGRFRPAQVLGNEADGPLSGDLRAGFRGIEPIRLQYSSVLLTT